MNAAGTRAPEAAGAEGTRLASGGSSRPRRRAQPEESPAAAPGGAGEWQAAGAPRRFLPASPPRPHPAATPGPASGRLRRQCWAELLVLGLLVAGAADGCELVPRHLRGRRAAGSAATATSSPAAAAGDSPALMTGEGPGGGGRGSAGCCGIPIPGRGPSRYSTTPAGARCRVRLPGASALAAASSPSPGLRTPSLYPPTPGFRQSLSTELASPPFTRAPPGSTLSNAERFSSVLQDCQQGLQGTGLSCFFFLKLLEKSAAALRY